MTNEAVDLKHFRNGWKLPILLGTLVGVFPRSNLLADDRKLSKRKHRPSFSRFVYSLILTIYFTTDSFLLVRRVFLKFNLPGQTLIKKLGVVNLAAYSLCVTFLYCYQLVYCTRFRSLLAGIRQSMVKLGTRYPYSFTVFSWVVCISCIILGVAEDLLYDLHNFARREEATSEDSPGPSLLSDYYSNFLSNWHEIIPPENKLITLALVLLLKLGTWGLAIMDAVIIILCHSLSLQFNVLHQLIQSELMEPPAPVESSMPVNSIRSQLFSRVKAVPEKKKPITWDSAMGKFWMLVDLTTEAGRYLSPIIILSHVCLCHILLMIFAWISPGVDGIFTADSTGYVYYSSAYFIVRLAVVTYFVSQVYHSSHAILNTLERCPSARYAVATERLTRKLTGNPVGIRIFGTFLITRHSFVSFISFIFTAEIILLQMANLNKPAPALVK